MSLVEEENEMVDDLAVMMKGKLRANSHKDSWRGPGTDLWYLVGRMKQEVEELEAEIHKLEAGEATPAKVRMECADVANLAAMVSDLSKVRHGSPNKG